MPAHGSCTQPICGLAVQERREPARVVGVRPHHAGGLGRLDDVPATRAHRLIDPRRADRFGGDPGTFGLGHEGEPYSRLPPASPRHDLARCLDPRVKVGAMTASGRTIAGDDRHLGRPAGARGPRARRAEDVEDALLEGDRTFEPGTARARRCATAPSAPSTSAPSRRTSARGCRTWCSGALAYELTGLARLRRRDHVRPARAAAALLPRRRDDRRRVRPQALLLIIARGAGPASRCLLALVAGRRRRPKWRSSCS